jgi:PAS domain S-box-containing protein
LAGYRVSAAADGAMARTLLREHALDLLLIDGAESGEIEEKVLGAIREERRGVRSPAILRMADAGDLKSILDRDGGSSGLIMTSSEIKALVARIDVQLARRQATPAPEGYRNGVERPLPQRAAKPRAPDSEPGGTPHVLADALDAIKEGFVLWDSEDRLVTCNESYRRLFGASAAFVIPGVRFEDLMRRQLDDGIFRHAAGRTHEWLKQRVSQHRNPQGPLEEEFADGTWVRVTETRTGDGHIVGLCTEISQAKRREIALKTIADNNRRLAAAVNATTSTILITDPSRPGNPTVFANPALTAMAGWPVEEALGRDRSFLNGPETDMDEAARFERAMSEGRPVSTELRLSSRNGKPFWAEISASPIRGSDGRITNWVIIQTDITVRKETEEQLHHSQKIEMVGQLTGGLAHDLNNLLTIVLGNLESALGAGVGEDPESREMLKAALKATRQGADVTRRLLAFSRKRTQSAEITDLVQILDGFEKFIGRSLGSAYRIRVDGAPEIWRILVDAAQMENAILNLAINARDAMPEGGTLTLETANTVLADAIDVTGQPIADGEYARISVSDGGEGMSAKIVEKAIRPFFTTKQTGKGTGLGLSMVYGFVSQSGGFMQIESQPGQGTTVSLFFPRVPAGCAAAEVDVRPQTTGGTETLLVVDDEPDVCAVTAQQLCQLGYKVLHAGTAEEALRILDRNGPVDLLVTDIGLPGDMNGHHLAAAVRTRQPRTKVVLMSGSYDEAPTAPDRFVYFLGKPYDRTALASAVREALNADDAADPAEVADTA